MKIIQRRRRKRKKEEYEKDPSIYKYELIEHF